ncbi:MAG: YkvA family protein [Patescibacteria group bacterium]
MLSGEDYYNYPAEGVGPMGVLIQLDPKRRCKNRTKDGEEVQILSERHQEILKGKIKVLIKTVNAKDISAIRTQTLNKIEEIHSHKDFIVNLSKRAKLLYEMLFDAGFPKSRTTEKTIAAGLLYLISPRDFLPDDVPGLGYLDDAYIIREVFELACFEIRKYIAVRGFDENIYF